MKFIRNIIKTLFPKTYIKFGMRKAKIDYKKHQEEAKKQSTPMFICNYDLWELEEWLQAIEDKELTKKAEKMDIYLDEIPYPEIDTEDPHQIKNSHYYYSNWGDKLLNSEVRKTLIKKIRERNPHYRKEKREVWEFWIKSGGVIIGVLGALSGLIAVLSKTKDCL